MKKIFPFIILIICLQVNAQDKLQAITVTGYGKHDTLRPIEYRMIDTKNLTRKLISQEISLTQPLDVIVEMSGSLTVKVWNESKVKIESGVWIDGKSELTDEKWLEKVGISSKLSGNEVKVNIGQMEKTKFIGTVNSGLTYTSDRNRTGAETVYKGDGSYLGTLNGNREVILYVPASSKLEIDNKFSLLTLVNKIKNLSILNTNGEVNAQDIDQLELHSSAGRFTAGIIRNGDITISHGRLYVTELTKGVLTTAYNTIEIQKAGEVQLNSASDDIDINETGSISGIKNYGSLLINVSGKLDLQGVNSRIKLRNIAPSADLIRIFDMNTDLRIPLHEPKSYAVDVRGNFINLYSSYADRMTTDTLTSSEAAELKTRRDSLFALAKIMGTRNHALTAGGGISDTRTERPLKGSYTISSSVTVNNGNRFQSETITLKDSIIKTDTSAIVKDGRLKSTTPITLNTERIKVGSPITLKDSLIKPATTITIKEGFPIAKNFRYNFITGDKPIQTKFEIICTNCTVDFK